MLIGLPFALGVLVSPLGVIAAVVIAISPRSGTRSAAFTSAWALSLCVVSVLAGLLVAGAERGIGSPSSQALTNAKAIIGVVLVVVGAIRLLQGWRSSSGSLPAWLSAAQHMAPRRCASLAVLIAGIKPKNLLLSIAAGSSIASAHLGAPASVGAYALFVLVGTLSVASPGLWRRVGGTRAEASLEHMGDWLARNNTSLIGGMLVVFGAYFAIGALG